MRTEDMKFRIAGEVVGLAEAARVADRLGLLGMERIEFFKKAALSESVRAQLRSGVTRVTR